MKICKLNPEFLIYLQKDLIWILNLSLNFSGIGLTLELYILQIIKNLNMLTSTGPCVTAWVMYPWRLPMKGAQNGVTIPRESALVGLFLYEIGLKTFRDGGGSCGWHCYNSHISRLLYKLLVKEQRKRWSHPFCMCNNHGQWQNSDNTEFWGGFWSIFMVRGSLTWTPVSSCLK